MVTPDNLPHVLPMTEWSLFNTAAGFRAMAALICTNRIKSRSKLLCVVQDPSSLGRKVGRPKSSTEDVPSIRYDNGERRSVDRSVH